MFYHVQCTRTFSLTKVKRGKAIAFPHGIEFCAEGMCNIVSRQKSLARDTHNSIHRGAECVFPIYLMWPAMCCLHTCLTLIDECDGDFWFFFYFRCCSPVACALVPRCSRFGTMMNGLKLLINSSYFLGCWACTRCVGCGVVAHSVCFFRKKLRPKNLYVLKISVAYGLCCSAHVHVWSMMIEITFSNPRCYVFVSHNYRCRCRGGSIRKMQCLVSQFTIIAE